MLNFGRSYLLRGKNVGNFQLRDTVATQYPLWKNKTISVIKKDIIEIMFTPRKTNGFDHFFF